ncbi:hypothetical protein ACHAQI_003237 [Fusarium lateritium]
MDVPEDPRDVVKEDAMDSCEHGLPNSPLTQFHPFLRLPLEIQDEIWKHLLTRKRTLHIRLETVGKSDYNILLEECEIISSVFHVHRESRRCALRYYRVQLPCHYFWDHKRSKGQTLYFNLELDTLRVKIDGEFAKFAKDLYLKDPSDILGDSEETCLQYAQLIKARCFRSDTQPAARFWAFSVDSLQNVTKDTEASKEVIVFDGSIEDTLKQDLELK